MKEQVGMIIDQRTRKFNKPKFYNTDIGKMMREARKRRIKEEDLVMKALAGIGEENKLPWYWSTTETGRSCSICGHHKCGK
jgi:hypothetical protein